ncbi:MAG: DUF3109 family protein [Bacteroidales bacterium]|jgi:hypothetical protein|nr:DUF3109 family protein [Bacteroidales bacterium]MCI1784954.1 DUF3109 family protein [Bacteroidales bacterium]
MTKDYSGAIISIGDCLVHGDVISEYFCCDYQACKGACCVAGESGAPLDVSEVRILERYYPCYSGLMGPDGRKAVSGRGFFEIDSDGDVVTPVVEGSGECAYSFFDEDENCRCSIERSFISGKCPFRKPVSCSLYPIRVTKLESGFLELKLHRWEICKNAFELGKDKNIRVFEFLHDAIAARFGEEFYSALSEASKRFFAAS